MEKVTIGVVNFNGMNVLPETLESIHNLDYPAFDVVVVDNKSTDGSPEWVQDTFPEVRLIPLDSNIGLPAARNVLLQEAETDYVFILDNDLTLEPDVLIELMRVMGTVPNVAACHAEIRDKVDTVDLHYNGGWIHYLCTHIARSNYTEKRPQYEAFDVMSGQALLINREIASRIGGFDADYFFNWEDGDFTARCTLAGYLCLNVPGAVAYHLMNPRGTSRVFMMTRNRWYFILKLYSWRTLILASPMFVIFELSQMVFLSMKGSAIDYVKGNFAALHDLPAILRKRRAFQKLKVKRERDWLRGGDMYIPPGLVKGKSFGAVMKIYGLFFGLYWKMIRRFC